MSRIAAGVALVLAAVCGVAGVLGAGVGDRNLSGLDLSVGAVVALTAVVGLRGHRSAQIVMSAGALFLLGRALPVYFQISQMWPFLAVIVLASVTFGFGVLGILLDSYSPKGRV